MSAPERRARPRERRPVVYRWRCSEAGCGIGGRATSHKAAVEALIAHARLHRGPVGR